MSGTVTDMSEEEQDHSDERPSKSARKREAHALQKLGERLLAMRESDVESLGVALPEELRDALREGRRLTSRGALARQRQYIGRLMRDVDAATIEAAFAAKEAAHAAHARLRR
jgi:ribosome-associated protein